MGHQMSQEYFLEKREYLILAGAYVIMAVAKKRYKCHADTKTKTHEVATHGFSSLLYGRASVRLIVAIVAV